MLGVVDRFWVEPHDIDGLPLPRVTRPALGVASASRLVHVVALLEDDAVTALVAVLRCDEADAAVQVLGVVPIDE